MTNLDELVQNYLKTENPDDYINSVVKTFIRTRTYPRYKYKKCENYDFNLPYCAEINIDILSKILNFANDIYDNEPDIEKKIYLLKKLKTFTIQLDENAITGQHNLEKLNYNFIKHLKRYFTKYGYSNQNNFGITYFCNTVVRDIIVLMLNKLGFNKRERSRSNNSQSSPSSSPMAKTVKYKGGEVPIETGPRGGKFYYVGKNKKYL